MASPVIQIKRGSLANLPGLRSGEPALTTDTFDFYVGIDSTTNNNKFFGSHRYWTKETNSTGSAINLVEGVDNGTNSISLKSPNLLSSSLTYTLPGVITDGYFLKVSSDGTLSWENVTGSGASFEGATLTGITSIQGSLQVSATSEFTGVTTFSNIDVNGGSIDGTPIGASTPDEGYFTLVDTDSLISDNSSIGFATATDLHIDSTRVLYDDGSGITLAGIQTVDATTRETLEFLLSFAPNDFTSLNVSGISTFSGNVIANGDVTLGDSSADAILVKGTATFEQPITGTISTATQLQNARDFSVTGAFVTSPVVSFDGTGNVALAATISENSITLGTYTSGDYVQTVTGGDGLFSTGAVTGEGVDHTLSVITGAGITITSDAVALKNAASLTNNTLQKWDSVNSQLVNSIITDDGSSAILAGNLTVSGNIIGTASTATRAATVDTTATSTDATYYIPFVSNSTTTTGETLRVDPGISYNPNSDTLDVAVVETGAVRAADGTNAITIDNSTGNVSVASSLTVTGDLTILGSQTVVNTTELKVEDNLIDLGLVNSNGSLVPPSTDANIDVGVLFHYYTDSAKKSGIFWDDSTGRIGIASDLTVTNNVVDTATAIWAPIEVGALWLNDCAGQSQVINCLAGERFLGNITVDGGSF
jgi:hypothetical protein